MSRIFITGSSDGLGQSAARTLLNQGHEVVLHARSKDRAAAMENMASTKSSVVIGDLASAEAVRSIANQVNEIGRMDAVIHNAGIYLEPQRGATPEGHAKTLAVNTLAPYMLTALINRPDRLIYMSSGMHIGGSASLEDIDWHRRSWGASAAYSESKLHVAALAAAVARYWPDVVSSSVDPGWVPTKMGGPSATDDLEEGHMTQTWLAVSNDADAIQSGSYWHHRRSRQPAQKVIDTRYQDELVSKLGELTGIDLFAK